MLLKTCLIGFFLVCNLKADIATGTFGFASLDPGSSIGGPVSDAHRAALQSGIKEVSGDDSAAITFPGKWQVALSGSFQTQFKLNMESSFIAAIRLGIALQPKVVVSTVSDQLDKQYATAGTPRLGKLTFLKMDPPPQSEQSAEEKKKQEKMSKFIQGSMEIKIPGDLASVLANPAQKADVTVCLAKIAVTFGLKADTVEVSQIKVVTGGLSFFFKLTKLSTAQEEYIRAALSVPDTLAKYSAELRKCPPPGGPTSGRRLLALEWQSAKATEAKPEPSTTTEIYEPPEYVPSSDTTTLNGIARVQGEAEFPSSLLPLGGSSMDWLIGIIIVAAPCIWCACMNMWICPCLFCCCPWVQAIKKREGLDFIVNKWFLSAIFAYVCVMIGFIVGLTGDAKVGAGMENFGNAFADTAGIVTQMENIMAGLTAGLSQSKAALVPKIGGCPAAKNLYDAVGAMTMEAPIPKEIQTLFSSASTTMIDANSIRGTVLPLLMVIGPLLAIVPLLFIIKTQLKFRTCESLFGCMGCCTSPLAFMYMSLLWLLSGVLTVLALVFADFCIKDPVATIISLLGDRMKDMEFLITCKGVMPATFSQIYGLGTQITETTMYIDGLKVMLEKGVSGPGCQGIDYGNLKAGFAKVGNAADQTIDLLRCKTFNSIFTEILYEGVCYNFVSGFAMCVICFSFMAAFHLVVLFLYRKYRKTASKILDHDEVEMGSMGTGKELVGVPLEGQPLGSQSYSQQPLQGQPMYGQPVQGQPAEGDSLMGGDQGYDVDKPTSAEPVAAEPMAQQVYAEPTPVNDTPAFEMPETPAE